MPEREQGKPPESEDQISEAGLQDQLRQIFDLWDDRRTDKGGGAYPRGSRHPVDKGVTVRWTLARRCSRHYHPTRRGQAHRETAIRSRQGPL